MDVQGEHPDVYIVYALKQAIKFAVVPVHEEGRALDMN